MSRRPGGLQVVWWWDWPAFRHPFFFRRFKRAWRMVYRWSVRVGPLEVRRWA